MPGIEPGAATVSSTTNPNSTMFVTTRSILRFRGLRTVLRGFHDVPFKDDLTPLNDDLFNLDQFQHYKEAPEVAALRKNTELDLDTPAPQVQPILSFIEACTTKGPVVFKSQLSDPCLNLSIEDYIYNKMPLSPTSAFSRLMFYINTPCVVIGKNQNPWREANLPLLENMRIPLIRRRSGGGTVVHDTGNVNYSYMTRKEDFDRMVFANLVAEAVNNVALPSKHVTVNERGDIVTKKDNLKVSGSAYKLSRGKSYHHGTMLLNLNLKALRAFLHRDESKIGSVTTSSAVASVKSPVTNLNISKELFIDEVARCFKAKYGVSVPSDKTEADNAQTELLGLLDFVTAYSEKDCLVFTIDETTELPQEVYDMQRELQSWEWRFGATPKFSHEFTRSDLTVRFDVDKKGLVTSATCESSDPQIEEGFDLLTQVLKRGDQIKYTGSNIAGFILHDEVSDWIGNAIDGTS